MGLCPSGSAALLPPTANSLVEKVDVGSIRLPRFREFGTVAARATIGRQTTGLTNPLPPTDDNFAAAIPLYIALVVKEKTTRRLQLMQDI